MTFIIIPVDLFLVVWVVNSEWAMVNSEWVMVNSEWEMVNIEWAIQ